MTDPADTFLDDKNIYEDERVTKIIHGVKESYDKKLNLNGKELTVIPPSIFKLQHLQFLYLARNNLEVISFELGETLSNLQWLDLRFNSIKLVPDNISSLSKLKNLLLEGNNITELPLSLGDMSNLSGLNLAENPIEFPPQKIIELGTKAVLKFLREQTTISDQLKGLTLENGTFDNENNLELEDYNSADESHQQPISPKKSIVKIQVVNPCRRHSYDETIVMEQQNDTNLFQIKAHYDNKKAATKPKQRDTSSAPYRRRPNKISSKNEKFVISKKNPEKKKGNYFRDELPGSKYMEELKQSEQRKTNERADEIIQKQKNKVVLDDWRKKSKVMQKKKKKGSSKGKHELTTPYGNDFQHTDDDSESIQVDGLRKHIVDKNTVLRELRDKKLEEKIQEHIKNIREWKRIPNTLTVENEIETAKNNLQKAIDLQRALEAKRATEYRLRAFTGEDFVPSLH